MSYLLETLGRGLLGRLLDAFESQFPGTPEGVEALARRQRHATTSFDLAMRLGTAYLREARLNDARNAFERARGLHGPARLPSLGLACVHAELGQLDRAIHCLGQIRSEDSSDPTIPFAIGLCLEQQGNPEAAAQSYSRSIELCPRLRNAWERLAAIALTRGDWDKARACYGELAALVPDDLDVLLAVANLNLQQGNAADAVEVYQRALLIEPESASETLDDADELENDGQLQQAIGALETLVGKYPGATEFRVHLADLYVKAGDDQRAVAQYHAALDLHPSLLEATVKLGTQHLRRQRYSDAAQVFNRAVELNDRLLTAFIGLGVAQSASGSEGDAQATFDLAASLAPNSTLLFSETNRLHLKSLRRSSDGDVPGSPLRTELGQDQYFVEALRRHQQLLHVQPYRADLRYQHGMLLRQMGDFTAAKRAFQEVVSISPSYVQALVKLGITCRELGQADEALDIFRRVFTVDPQQIHLHYELGLLFAQRNRFELVVEQFEDKLAGQPGADEFRDNLTLALQNIGMVDRAEATWRLISELAPADPARLPQGRLRANRGTWRA